MSTGEFDLIGRYFSIQKGNQHFIDFSIGDDCAITHIPEGYQLAITTDTMVEGTHFLSSISPQNLAYKAIATNLSDLAAMGAKPVWISLALTLPEVDENWLNQFSQSLFDTLNQYDVTLIGGDTTKGPLSVTITAQGFVPKGKALFRHKAKVGDLIYVSGTLGDSAAGLNWILQGKSAVDFDTEFLDYILAVKVVDGVEEAVGHIEAHSTHHSDAIVTENPETVAYFTKQVDSAAVYVNASTRFTDGNEFGFGAEIGISTQKLHARGPMGLEALTTTKYIIYGDGQIR